MATIKVTEQKVILCGEYGVGKTSIFRRFANNTFVASNDRKSTLGLDNIDKEYVVEDRRIRVSVQCRQLPFSRDETRSESRESGNLETARGFPLFC
jgi:GTPase SAR1 family protein